MQAQKGSLAEAFAKHEEHCEDGSDGKAEKWRETLTEGANLSSWDLHIVINGLSSWNRVSPAKSSLNCCARKRMISALLQYGDLAE
ncbi:uncharacterized protein LOC130773437 isoform X2 [Actinidia eriantha]|uniref:uncharacterized protein LOC130773437 isoform X2 n=1 Tax=Actinidia eriantha TaxID=165200 RepID=UPI0025885201|nr:uncharacterized protein LOC130773437 isoform X2 [Actinidia eriantha]